MGIVNFILSLQSRQLTVEPDPVPEPEVLHLDIGEGVVNYTGAQTEASSIAGTHNLYAPCHVWHNGYTYFCYQGVYQAKGLGQGYLSVYDEMDGIKKPYRIGNLQQLHPVFNLPDTHTKPTFDVDKYGKLWMWQERTHDTPIDQYTGDDFNNMDFLTEKIGDEISYLHAFKDPSGNGILWCRMMAIYEAEGGGHLAYVTSSDGYDAWGSETRVSTNPRPDTSTAEGGGPYTRQYPQVPYYNNQDDNYYYLLGTQRNDDSESGLGAWIIPCLFRTKKAGADSFVVFENCEGELYSHDISGGNYITETDMINHFAYYHSGGEEYNIFSAVSTVNEGYFFDVRGKTENGEGLVLIVINLDTRVRTIKDLNIPNLTSFDPTTQQVHAVKHIAYHYGYLEIGCLVDNEGTNELHLYKSYNLGDTFDEGENLFPEVEVSLNTLSFPWNYYDIPKDRNFAIYAMRNDTDTDPTSRAMYVKRAAKGTLQAETPRIIIPNTNYSDEFDLFDYQFGDGQITRSGNNITGITDQFGIRNATGVNNPQWNGSNAATLNGTNNYFTIPTTGLTALTKLTLFAVFRTVGGANANLLCFANNALSDAFLAFFGANSTDGNGPSLLFRKTTLTQLRDYANIATNDNNLKLLTVVVDGRCKTDFYINGAKSHYNVTGTDARLVDRGRLDYGTVTNIRIGHNASSNAFTAQTMQQLMAKHHVYTYGDQRAIEKQIADMHGITLNYGYDT